MLLLFLTKALMSECTIGRKTCKKPEIELILHGSFILVRIQCYSAEVQYSNEI